MALYLGVQGIETDEPWLEVDPLPLFGFHGGASPDHGSGDHYEWAVAATTIFLSSSFDHVQDATETVTFSSPSHDGLMFQVEANLTFNYHL